MPLLTWVLLAFLITFLWFFIVPVFYDPSGKMQFINYIRTISPIGIDFRVTAGDAAAWLHSGSVPPILYPPLALVFFAPFALMGLDVGYRILTLIILACYIVVTLILPPRISRARGISALVILLFATGILSYGLQFELERGQWNLIAFTLCLVAVWLFHLHPKARWIAYVLFTLAVQLKLYPAIFVFALVDQWSDWKNSIRRFVGLGLANILALFVLGLGPIQAMLGSQAEISASHSALPFNLSISSFVLHILSLHTLPHKRIIIWMQSNAWFPELLLIGFFAVCLAIVIWRAHRDGIGGFDPYLFMVCTIGALMIPSISFDYKLALLPASTALLVPALESLETGRHRVWLILLTLALFISYSSTLYPELNRPEWLRYIFPMLFVLLLATTLLSLLSSPMPSEPAAEPPVASTP